MRKLTNVFPELYFISLSALWTAENYFSTGHINYFAVLIAWLMFLQIFYKHKTLGLIYGNLVSVSSVYLLVSLLSEFNVSHSLFTQGLAGVLLSAGVVMGISMVYKYAKATSKYDESVLTVSF